MTKIAALSVLALALLAPMASACYYPQCSPTNPWTFSLNSTPYTFDRSLASLTSVGNVQATAQFSFTAQSGSSGNYSDTISVTITDLTDQYNLGIKGIGFTVSSGNGASWVSGAASTTGVIFDSSTGIDFVGIEDTATKTSGSVTDKVKITGVTTSNITISSVYFVYSNWAYYNEAQGNAGTNYDICANTGFAPEPASMALMGLGLLAVAVTVRKRRKS